MPSTCSQHMLSRMFDLGVGQFVKINCKAFASNGKWSWVLMAVVHAGSGSSDRSHVDSF